MSTKITRISSMTVRIAVDECVRLAVVDAPRTDASADA